MKKQLKKVISLERPSSEFQSFLNIPYNSRIIFSGIFGSGKTFFLKQFFDNNEKYIAIQLYPTNYVASKNEDVFELIKFDILFELLKRKPPLESLKFSYFEALPIALNEAPITFFKSLIEAIPKIGKALSVIIEPLQELNSQIKSKAIQVGNNEKDRIEKFAEVLFNQKGNAYESDLHTELIIELISRLRENKISGGEKKEIVLIIDDLDRIDPDNIFRLLNIFSVHFDALESEQNKFGFDKVIFCCDIFNLRNIFHSRFGQLVDFSGYIDKFYSTEIFEFDNRESVKAEVESILLTIKPINRVLFNPQKLHPLQDQNFQYLKFILYNMIESNTLSLRRLISFFEHDYKEKKYRINKSRQFSNFNIYILSAFDFLLALFESEGTLIRSIERTNFGIYNHQINLGRFASNLKIVIDNENRLDRIAAGEFKSADMPVFEYNIMESSSNYCDTVFYGDAQIRDRSFFETIDYSELLSKALKAYFKTRGTSF